MEPLKPPDLHIITSLTDTQNHEPAGNALNQSQNPIPNHSSHSTNLLLSTPEILKICGIKPPQSCSKNCNLDTNNESDRPQNQTNPNLSELSTNSSQKASHDLQATGPNITTSLNPQNTSQPSQTTLDHNYQTNNNPKPNPNLTTLKTYRENRNVSKGFKLTKVESLEGNVVYMEEEGMDLGDAWNFTLVGFLIGRLLFRESVERLCNSWKVSYKYHVFEDGWMTFKFESMEDMLKVLEMGPYMLAGRPLCLKEMPPYFRFEECHKCVPVWVKFPGFPIRLWNENALSKLASKIGTPLASDACTKNKERIGYARLLVEINASKELVREVGVELPNGVIYQQKVVYEFEPLFCTKCSKLGHNQDEFLILAREE